MRPRSRVKSRCGFTLNDRVRLSPYGIERSIRMGARGTGVVVGFGRRHGVIVLPSGNKTAGRYHDIFIERIPDQSNGHKATSGCFWERRWKALLTEATTAAISADYTWGANTVGAMARIEEWVVPCDDAEVKRTAPQPDTEEN